MKIFCGKKDPLKPFSAQVFCGNKMLDPEPSRKVLALSADGYDWGALLPATRQLALALILEMTGSVRKAQRLYTALAEDVLAYLPPQWVLTEEDLAGWAMQRKQVTH